MSVEIPSPVSAGSVSTWSDEVDVLVLGAGMAGVSAALEARTAGASVLVVDRGGKLTCTSAMAGGHFYLGAGTAVQQATGWDDSADEMARYLTLMSPECDPAKIRAYADDSVEHFNWLESLGFEFERSFFPGKYVVQPNTEGLMFTGNEKCLEVKAVAKPAPRGHKVPKPGDTGGGGVVVDLALDRLESLGVEVRWETSATALILDGDRVVGATWKRYDAAGAIRAKSVVIAAGGFVMNREMVETYAPDLLAVEQNGMALGNSYDDGLGIRMGQSVGGVAEHLERVFLTGPFYPPGEALRGIAVNKQGKRFVNEDAYHARTAAFVFEQPERTAYLILDSATMVQPTYGFQPLVDGWETVEEMEEGLGIPAGELAKTMAAYNEAAVRGADPEFHKAPEYVVPLDQGPWGAYDLTPGKCFYTGFSCGGLRVTIDGEVLRDDGSIVHGVYAAGACASNIAIDGKGYSSGTQLGEASYFGRRCGRHAARSTS